MRHLLGLPLPDSVLRTWAQNMVFALEPLFLPITLAQNFDVPLTRSEFGHWSRLQPLEYVDAYQPWRVSSQWVVLAEHIPAALLPDINEAVIQSKRGMVFALDAAKEFGVPEALLQRDSSGEQFILRLDAWQSLTQEQRFAWLCSYVSEDNIACHSSQYPEFAHLVGWQPKSGANCFSTALLGHAPHLRDIPEWLQPQTLLRWLEQHGYGEQNTSYLEPCDVLIWKNGEQVVHACTYLGNGLVLNKDSQTWYAPRQVLPLEVVLERWNEANVVQSVYAKT